MSDKKKPIVITDITINKKSLSSNINKINKLNSQFDEVIEDFTHILPKETIRLDKDFINKYMAQSLNIKEKLIATKKSLKNIHGFANFDKNIKSINIDMILFMRRAQELVEYCTYQHKHIEDLKNHIKSTGNDIEALSINISKLDNHIARLKHTLGEDIKIKPCNNFFHNKTIKTNISFADNPSICNLVKTLLIQTNDRTLISKIAGNYFKALQERDQQLMRNIKIQIYNIKLKQSCAIEEEKLHIKNFTKGRMAKIFIESINKARFRITNRDLMTRTMSKIRSSCKFSNVSSIPYTKAMNLNQLSQFDKRRIFHEFISHPEVSSFLSNLISFNYESTCTKDNVEDRKSVV